MVKKILFPLATALWLVRNTKLSREQICQFCDINDAKLSYLEVMGEVKPQNPIEIGQLDIEDVRRCEANHSLSLSSLIKVTDKHKKALSTDQKKMIPNAIAWLVNQNFKLSPESIARLFKITRKKVNLILENISSIEPKNPIMYGICTREEIDIIISSVSEKR